MTQITRAQYEQRQRQEQDPIGNEQGNRSGQPSGGHGGSTGSGGGGTTSGGAISIPTDTRVLNLNRALIASGSPIPTLEQRQELINGLAPSQITDEILSFLLDTDLIKFDANEDGLVIVLTNAQLVTQAELEALKRYNFSTMNYPTAEHAAKTKGTPIARASWQDADGNPTKWLVFEKGAFYLYTAEARKMVEAGDFTEADYRATDWHFPRGCTHAPEAKPDIGGDSQAVAPTFNILNPPCSVR